MAMAKTWSLTGAALDARSRQIMDVSEWLRAWAGVTLDNYIVFGVFGALLTALSWLAVLSLMDHPVMNEVKAAIAA